jgi:hypothetical protein
LEASLDYSLAYVDQPTIINFACMSRHVKGMLHMTLCRKVVHLIWSHLPYHPVHKLRVGDIPIVQVGLTSMLHALLDDFLKQAQRGRILPHYAMDDICMVSMAHEVGCQVQAILTCDPGDQSHTFPL